MAEMTSECHVIETSRNHVSAEANEILKQLLRPGIEIEAVIPADAPPEELWRTLDACVHGLRLLESRTLRLKPIIGHILLLFENKPSLYKGLGYDTYGEFMRKGVHEVLGLHHTSAYEGRLAAKEWPQLTPDRYAKIGPKKLSVLSKFTDGKSSTAESWLDVAEKMKVREFKEYVEQRGFLSRGEATGATFSFTTNMNRMQKFKHWFNDGRIQSFVGSKDWDIILEMMIAELEVEWLDKEEARRQNDEASAGTSTPTS